MTARAATIVVAAPEGQTLREPTSAQAIDDLVSTLQRTPQIAAGAPVVGPVAAASAQREQLVDAAVKAGQPRDVAEANAAALSPLSADSRVGTISLTFDVDKPTDIEKSTQDYVANAMSSARATGLTVEASGSALQSFELPGGSSEAIGIAIAALVLVLTFGSLVAAGLPILTALVGVGIGALGVTAATAFVNVGSTTPILATMLGLAVGIDYALFILSRYRAELLHHDDREEAAGLAVGRAGSAVVFAGLTVVIALAALGVVGIPLLTSMGVAAAATVLVAVVIALTLLPALLGMLGGKAFAGRVRRDRIVADELESEPSDDPRPHRGHEPSRGPAAWRSGPATGAAATTVACGGHASWAATPSSSACSASCCWAASPCRSRTCTSRCRPTRPPRPRPPPDARPTSSTVRSDPVATPRCCSSSMPAPRVAGRPRARPSAR